MSVGLTNPLSAVFQTDNSHVFIVQGVVTSHDVETKTLAWNTPDDTPILHCNPLLRGGFLRR